MADKGLARVALTELRWFERQRIEWIAETLRIFGFINRDHLEKKFGISTPQASMDLTRFQQLQPGAMIYDKSTKRYVASRRARKAIALAERGA